AKKQRESTARDAWNSDDDNATDMVIFLGFHPCKEVIFLYMSTVKLVACHLKSTEIQYLGGLLGPVSYNCGLEESFVYTPCLVGL
uniref:Uncharacterized protein n=1 Tax=Setaria italica TaxID=4555 RepID=K3ZMT9_SETIT